MERLFIGSTGGTRCIFSGFKGTLLDLKAFLEQEFISQGLTDKTSRKIASAESVTDGIRFSYVWHIRHGEVVQGELPVDKELDLTVFCG